MNSTENRGQFLFAHFNSKFRTDYTVWFAKQQVNEMKYFQKTMWLVILASLIATGCSTVPLPKYAKRGDYVTIPLGGTKTVGNSNYLTKNDVTVTVTDIQGQVFPAAVNRLFRVYADPSSRYALLSKDADSYLFTNNVSYANEGQWMLQFEMPATNDLSQTPAAGIAQIAVASTELNPDPDPLNRQINLEPRYLNEDLSALPFEILEGDGDNLVSEVYGMGHLELGATILVTPDNVAGLINNVGGAVYVFEYSTDSFIAADYNGVVDVGGGLPHLVKTSPDQHLQLATSRKDLGGNITQLTAMVINPYGFHDDATWVPGTSYYDALNVAFSWDTGVYIGQDIVDDTNWQSHVSLVASESYYIDLNGNIIPNVTPVLSKVR